MKRLFTMGLALLMSTAIKKPKHMKRLVMESK